MTNRYHKQLILPHFGINAQNALKNARIFIAGCGGLGSPVIQYLAATGVGQITVCDPDIIDLTNLHRQTIYRETDMGKNKVLRAKEFIQEINSEVQVEVQTNAISTENVHQIVANHQIMIDCMDGLANKFLLNDACMMAKKPLIHGAATQTEGRLKVITPESSCLRCLFEHLPTELFIPSCQEAGILGPVCGVIGSMMAIETIKCITGFDSIQDQHYFIVKFEGLPTIMAHKIEKNIACKLHNS